MAYEKIAENYDSKTSGRIDLSLREDIELEERRLNMKDHVCKNVTGMNLSYRVNLQRDGLIGIFDHTLNDLSERDLLKLNYDKYIQRWIENQEDIQIIPDKLISKDGHYIDGEEEWITLGTISDLYGELKQEVQYQLYEY